MSACFPTSKVPILSFNPRISEGIYFELCIDSQNKNFYHKWKRVFFYTLVIEAKTSCSLDP